MKMKSRLHFWNWFKEGVSKRPVKKCCAFFGHISIFSGVLFIYYHVGYLNILNFCDWFHFWSKKKMKHFYCCVILERYLGHVLLIILYLAQALTGQRTHYSKCLNGVTQNPQYSKTAVRKKRSTKKSARSRNLRFFSAIPTNTREVVQAFWRMIWKI